MLKQHEVNFRNFAISIQGGNHRTDIPRDCIEDDSDNAMAQFLMTAEKSTLWIARPLEE